MRLDAVLLLLFFVIMYDRLTQNPLHEALGTAVRRPRRPSVKNRISTISNIELCHDDLPLKVRRGLLTFNRTIGCLFNF